MKTRTLLIALLVLFIAEIALVFAASNLTILFLVKVSIVLTATTLIAIPVLSRLLGTKGAKTAFINIALLLVTTGLCLVIAEYSIRQAFNDVTTTGDNSSYFARLWNHSHPPKINEMGFRERDIDPENADSLYRIAVIGDSFTYGQGIPDDERYTNLAEKHLDCGRSTHEVLNFGRSGSQTVDHLKFLDDYVVGLDPDFVILQWYVNDVEGNERFHYPHYPLIPSTYLAGWLHKHSALYYLVRLKWIGWQRDLALFQSYHDYMLAKFSDSESQYSKEAIGYFREFIEKLQLRSIPVGVIMFPTLVEAGGNIDNYPYGFLFDRMLKVCNEKQIKCIDLRQTFSNISPASTLWANRLDHHPGALANKMVTRDLLEVFGEDWGYKDCQ